MNKTFDFLLMMIIEIRLKRCKTEEEIPAAMCEMADFLEKYAKMIRTTSKVVSKQM